MFRRFHTDIAPMLLAILFSTCLINSTDAQALQRMHDFEKAFGYDQKKPPESFSVQQIDSTAPANAFWPGDETRFVFQIVNKTKHPLKASGKWELLQYATRSDTGDSFTQYVEKVRDITSMAASIDLPAGGFVNQNVTLPVPAEFGAYAVVLSLDGQGREIAAVCVRSIKVNTGRVRLPTYALDAQREEVLPLFNRIGIRGTRQEWGAFDIDDQKSWNKLDTFMKAMSDSNVTVMLTLMTNNGHMPMKCIRGLLNEKDEGKMDYPGDFAALPQFDADFQEWVKRVAIRYGWPKGPLNAVELWNEPWEGSSISGWGADMPRYREIYTHMAQGVEAARKEADVQVLIGGACSSMNTEDKLFADGNDEPFLKWLDFTSIHYQPMCAQPALIKRFAQRKNANGPTQAWDTETWVANSEDRVAGVLASMRAQGLSRTAGVLHDNARVIHDVSIHEDGGKTRRITSVQALAPAAAIAACQQFMGQRNFREVLFKNGLPWVFVFDGLPENGPDDGTVVVLGDMGALYSRDLLLFRDVLGIKARQRSLVARAKLAALPADATAKEVEQVLNDARAAEVLDNASMTIGDGAGQFISYDFYGNPIKSNDGKIVVPLNGFGYFVRTSGAAGSFAKLLDAIRSSRIEGYEPVEIVAHDLLARVGSNPDLRFSITNILNRPITGKLVVKLGAMLLENPTREVQIAPGETKQLSFTVIGGAAASDNTYPLTASFDAGADGAAVHEEAMHVNVIARRTITVDGSLDDWKDVLPQPIRSRPGAGRNLTEKAWLPFVKFDETAGQGFASAYLAYDDQNFYFAARIADATPDAGNVRFAKRDDDSYFYPPVVHPLQMNNKTHQLQRMADKQWPPDVRRFSYRRNPDLPSGSGTDNVQIAFNVLPIEQTDWLPYPPGTMPRFMCYKTTDYEYALNAVAPEFGGGTELWRLLAPGVPRKHFYPRQPKSPHDGGPVENGKLVIKRDGNTRIVECAIPWSEIPDVRKRLDGAQPIKFTFRVNDNKGPSYELNGGRSVSKIDTYALHDYWATSWAVETEFVFEDIGF